MKKLKVTSRDGFLNWKDLPHDCIFNKVITGCGGTSIVLKNDENYVIAVPTTELIINKMYPPYDEDKKLLEYDCIKRAGLSPVKNLFGLFGDFTIGLTNELRKYLNRDGTKKIMCTYNKLPQLAKYLNSKDYRLLIDEYHCLLKAYSYRDKAIDGVFESFRDYKSFCFMSATPILPDFKPDVLDGIQEYVADWKHTEKLKVLPYKTNKPYNAIANIIRKYKQDGYIIMDGHRSTEAYIFINSVRDIKSILDHEHLNNDECRIICADNDKNKQILGLYNISSSVDTAKMFNFITSKSFEGADYYSDSGICFIVSNNTNKHTLLDISTDIPQIAGRIRTENNPFRKCIIHIFNTILNDIDTSYEEIKIKIEKQLKIGKERAESFNTLSSDAKEQQREDLKKLSNSSYVTYDKGNDKFIVNDKLPKLELYNYKVNNIIYKSGISLKKAYEESGIETTCMHWEHIQEDVLKSLLKKPSFKEIFKRYTELKTSFTIDNTEIKRVEEKYPFIRDAYNKLGKEEIKKLRYSQRDIKSKLLSLNEDKSLDDKVYHILKEKLTIGEFITKEKAVDAIVYAYRYLGKENIDKIKGTDLNKWYDIDSTSKRVNGTPTYGFILKASKIFYENESNRLH
ncbi:hypothetical protein LDB17_15160 [Dysgonomonas sp. Shenzhen-Wh21]|uniref:hypothetical protein n=1 Tax=Dysgonomonas TaxID=156973 RepID=UPI00208F9713|nr:hypothetical protein [Dysgonomonas mossii]